MKNTDVAWRALILNHSFLRKKETDKRKITKYTRHPHSIQTCPEHLSLKETSCMFWFSLRIKQHVHLHSYQLCVLSVTLKPQLIPWRKNAAAARSLAQYLLCVDASTVFSSFSFLLIFYFISLSALILRLHPTRTHRRKTLSDIVINSSNPQIVYIYKFWIRRHLKLFLRFTD